MGIVVKLESCVEELLHPSTDAVVDGSSAASTLPWQNRPSRTSRLSWAATGGFFSSLEKDAGSAMTWRETKMQLKLKCVYKTKQKTVNNIKAINVCTLIVHTQLKMDTEAFAVKKNVCHYWKRGVCFCQTSSLSTTNGPQSHLISSYCRGDRIGVGWSRIVSFASLGWG